MVQIVKTTLLPDCLTSVNFVHLAKLIVSFDGTESIQTLTNQPRGILAVCFLPRGHVFSLVFSKKQMPSRTDGVTNDPITYRKEMA
jgi:hypothetical protein